MRLISYVQELDEIGELSKLGIKEVILTDEFLSRQGRSNSQMVISCAQLAKKYQMQVFFQWDLLVGEEQAAAIWDYWRRHYPNAPELFDAIRVQDVGALGMVRELFPSIALHLILETGHRNLVALQRWAQWCGDRLERMVLSGEIPHAHLSAYAQAFPGKLELLVIGPILLFYSPRHLISPLAGIGAVHQVAANSEESPHKGFRLWENAHGTLMYHTKDLFLLEAIPQLQALKLGAYRLDLRHCTGEVRSALLPIISNLMDHWRPELVAEAKKLYPHETTRGFFPVNKTDVLFGKLKNPIIRDSRFIGEVIQVAKDQHLAVKIIRGTLACNQEVEIINPDGKKRTLYILWIKNLRLEPLKSTHPEQVVLINYGKGISNRSGVFSSNHHNCR